MQIPFQQANCQISPWLARIISPMSRRLSEGGPYVSVAVAAGLLWLALGGL